MASICALSTAGWASADPSLGVTGGSTLVALPTAEIRQSGVGPAPPRPLFLPGTGHVSSPNHRHHAPCPSEPSAARVRPKPTDLVATTSLIGPPAPAANRRLRGVVVAGEHWTGPSEFRTEQVQGNGHHYGQYTAAKRSTRRHTWAALW